MAKRMKFSVVGLPHYTIWHLYEPSADDLKHMERMEEERLAKEAADLEAAEKEKKIRETWKNPKAQWEQDKKDMVVNQKDEAESHTLVGEAEAAEAKVGLKAGGGGTKDKV